MNNMLNMKTSDLIALAGPGDVDEPLHRQGQHTVDTARQGDAGQGEEGGQDQGEHPFLVHQGEGGQGERQGDEHLPRKPLILINLLHKFVKASFPDSTFAFI